MPIMIKILASWRGRHMGRSENLSLLPDTDSRMNF